VPTLNAGEPLRACLESLQNQTFRDFEVIVVNNGSRPLEPAPSPLKIRVLDNPANVGFGAAVNQGVRASASEFVATLNDDATAHPQWLESLMAAIGQRYEIGMCASKVILTGTEGLDSAGMLLCADGSSKQRGHGDPQEKYSRAEEVFFPSGSAALYRRDMLDETGGFDESFFLYCEDTDLGLRARWGGWECRFVPAALVSHAYSQSAGRASALKAFYVERNRLLVAVKNFPARMLWKLPWVSLGRYFWHAVNARRGQGAAAQFEGGDKGISSMLVIVLKAHAALLGQWREVWAKRRAVRRRLTSRQFTRMAKTYRISARRVAAL
jgi:GT2 family glycosyltransferase